MGWIGRVGLRYRHDWHYVWNRWLVGAHRTAQGTLLNALWRSKWEGQPKTRGIYVADSLLKTMMLGKIEGKRRRGLQRIRWLRSITNSMGMKLSKLWEIVKDRGAWQVTTPGVTKRWTWLNDWTETIIDDYFTVQLKLTRYCKATMLR